MRSITQPLLGLVLWCCGQHALAQPLIAHPELERPLSVKWQWALQQAVQPAIQQGADANTSRWLAYQFNTELDEKIQPHLHARRDTHADRWRRDDLNQWRVLPQGAFGNTSPQRLTTAALLAGNTRRQQELLQQHTLVVLARFDGDTLEELRITDAHQAVDWQGVPVFWLGNVTTGESFRALVAALDPARDPLMNMALLHAIGLHNDPDRAGLLFSLYNTPQWLELRPAIIDSLSLQRSAEIEQLLLEVAADENAPLAERRIAIIALHQVDSLAAENVLLNLVAALNPRVIRELAMRSLTSFDSSAVLDALNTIALSDQEEDIVKSAITNLSRLRTHAAHTSLLAIAKQHPQQFARDTALRLLQRALL